LKAKQDVTFNDVSQNQTKQKCTVVTLKAQKDVTLQDVSMNVALDVDMSGSMRLKDVDGAYNQMSAIFEAVATVLRTCSDEDHNGDAMQYVYTCILFNEQTSTLCQAAALGTALSRLDDAWWNVQPHGGTHYGVGLRGFADAAHAVEEMAARGDHQLGNIRHIGIFLSDGKPGDHAAEGVVHDLVERFGADALELHTVGFGPETGVVGPHNLRRLAELGGESFFDNEGPPMAEVMVHGGTRMRKR
jgi:hypothetical protein